jgi:predicted amidophosphoribosyltransferase
VGQDDQGHPLFETRRTPAGELLYRLKYKGDREAVRDLVAAAADFLRAWRPPVDMLVSVPASRGRALQPVALLAAALARELGLEFCRDCVRRTREHAELKDVHEYDARLRILADAHAVDRTRVQGRAVLLFDDLYRSGATMNSITTALYDAGAAAAVYGLTLTRTRSRR